MKKTINIDTALNIACKAHSGQWRKGSGAPYLVHPLDVARRIGRWGITKVEFPEVWAAAILHDVLEDTGYSFGDIELNCGIVVAEIVSELTFKGDRREKNDYLASFSAKSLPSLVIKVADRLSNVDDYLVEDDPYAVTYWGKATILFNVMFKRQDMIASTFGSSVKEKMLVDYSSVLMRILTQRSIAD